MVTLYEILEVSEKASKEVIEKAYKTLAKKYHPDLQQNQEQKNFASEKMKKINEAYDILSNEEKKKKYDEKLESERRKKEEININTNSNTFRANNNQEVNNDWRQQLEQLTTEEKRKIVKKIEQDAQKEYETMYRNYFKSMGYKVKNKVSFRGVCSLIITLGVLVIIIWILSLIPVTRNYGIKLYQDNMIIKILVDLIIGIIKGFIAGIKSIFSLKG